MIQFIKRLIFAWKYKRAVKKAIKLAKLTGLRYFVVYMNGSLKVIERTSDLLHHCGDLILQLNYK